MEYVDTDLAKLINTGQKLSAEHVKCIMLQVPLHEYCHGTDRKSLLVAHSANASKHDTMTKLGLFMM